MSKPDLEQSIFDDPNNKEAWQVYGDWLSEQGDVRGELITLDAQLESQATPDEALKARREALIEEHQAKWLGEQVSKALEDQDDTFPNLELDWRYGFLHSVFLRATWESDVDIIDVYRAMVGLDAFKFIYELRCGVDDLEGSSNFRRWIDPLTEQGSQLSLRRLNVGDFDSEEQEITWVQVGDLSPLWKALPNLSYLRVQGGGIELGSAGHGKLEALDIETAGLPRASVRSVSNGRFPALRHLAVWLGTEERSEEGGGGHSSVKDLEGLLDGNGVPSLRHLGLMNCDYADDIAAQLPTAPILGRLESLDLSMGTMGDEGARVFLDRKEAFSHLARINLDDNFISEGLAQQLTSTFGGVISVSSQEDPDEDYRYVTVSE